MLVVVRPFVQSCPLHPPRGAASLRTGCDKPSGGMPTTFFWQASPFELRVMPGRSQACTGRWEGRDADRKAEMLLTRVLRSWQVWQACLMQQLPTDRAESLGSGAAGQPT